MKWLSLLLIFAGSVHAQLLQTPDVRWSTDRWEAQWVAPPEQGTSYGIYHFRKKFDLDKAPGHFVIHVSGDNRYRLFVNGNYITEGPQLSDLRHWRFESLDIGSFLKEGQNILAVQIAYFGEAGPVSMMGRQAALIIQGNGKAESVINTDASWKTFRNEAVSPIIFRPGQPEVSHQYYAAGPLDRVDGAKFPWGWESLNYNDNAWKDAIPIQAGAPFGVTGFGDEKWELVPRNLPLMERTYEALNVLRKVDNSESHDNIAFNKRTPYTIQSNRKVTLLFDQTRLTAAFPEVVLSGGKDSQLKLTYAEALFNKIGEKGNRDSIRGKGMHGVYDIFIAGGGDHRVYTTNSYRAFRYLQVEITTGAEPLIIEKLGSWFTGYPFQKEATFSSSDPSQIPIFDIGWRTARLCAYDTYMDCPYWERLQYIGDTRIQALVSYYVSGDDRLARNAIEQFEWSLTYDGLTYSRYPSLLAQFIPNYSLVWVLMVHDHFMYRNDPAFVKTFLPGIKRVLAHFEQYLTADTLMGEQPYWDFLDHTFSTHKIVMESSSKKLTSNSLFYAHTLSRAAELFSYFGDEEQARKFARLSDGLKRSVQEQCWDAGRRLYADTPDKKHFSMHNNILAVLCGMMKKDQQGDLLKRIVLDKEIVPTTIYFDFYLARAMNQAGAGDLYYDLLDHWRELLNTGLTTFPEGGDRSDCHAWSASPNFEMLATFAGIEPQAPGFKKVLVRPLMQKLTRVNGSIPHWAGKIEVSFEKNGKTLSGKVVLPQGITGKLEWGDKVIELKSGANPISVVGSLR